MEKEIIVFAPHPDDETLGCGGTIAKKISEGYEVLIVFMTDGRNALKPFGIASGPSPGEMKEIREKEAIRAARILGVKEEKLFFLHIEEGSLEKSKEKTQEKVTEILNKTSPVEVYFPHRLDFNPDHRLTNSIIRNCLAKLNLHPCEYQYIFARRYDRVGSLKETILDLIKHHIVRIDISNFLPLKIVAMKEYRSQTTILSDRQKRPVLSSYSLRKHLKNEEMFIIGINKSFV